MSEIRTSAEPASPQVPAPSERCESLPGLIRSLRDKQRKEQIEQDSDTVNREDCDAN